MYVRVNHDGIGILQSDFERLSHTGKGLGLKNIASRVEVLKAKIFFDQDPSGTFYRATLQLDL